MAYNIVTIAGSLRKESFTLKIANALAKLAPDTLTLDVVTLNGISFFNQDLEGNPPADWLAFREKIQKSNGVLFVTPEYNRAIPGVLKNAIDVASRPYGKNSFDGKPTAALGTSQGAVGTAAAQQHLRSILACLNVKLMGQPEGYIVFKPNMIDANGTFTDEGTRKFMQGYVDAFAAWVDRGGANR